MNISESNIDFSQYKEITLCSPVWVFALSAPMRQFCKTNNGKNHNVSYVLNHFMNSKFDKVAKEMDNLLCTNHNNFASYRCRYGKLKKLN